MVLQKKNMIDYAGHYFNVIEEIKAENADRDPNDDRKKIPVIDEDYELMAYSNTKIDYEYIIQSDPEHCYTR